MLPCIINVTSKSFCAEMLQCNPDGREDSFLSTIRIPSTYRHTNKHVKPFSSERQKNKNRSTLLKNNGFPKNETPFAWRGPKISQPSRGPVIFVEVGVPLGSQGGQKPRASTRSARAGVPERRRLKVARARPVLTPF